MWPHTHRLQQLPQPALPQVPGGGGTRVARRAPGRPAAGRLLPRGLHRPRRDRRHRLPQQGGGLRPAVPGGIADHAHHRRRPTSPRCAHRRHRRPPYLGVGDDPPSAPPHDRARGRPLARRRALDPVPCRLPAAGSRARQAVPAAVPHRAARPAHRRAAQLLRRPCRPGGRPRLPPSPGAAAQDEVGGVREAAVLRAGGGARLLGAIQPTASPSRTTGWPRSTRPASPSATRTTAGTPPTAGAP